MALPPNIEAAVLNQTEEALDDLVNSMLNIGIEKAQAAMMLRAHADKLSPDIVLAPGITVQ